MALAIPFQDLPPDLALAGGKGANLAILSQLGLPVPDGFCLTTPAYWQFVQANGLEAAIGAALEQAPDVASDQIRRRFEAGCIPPELKEAVCSAYQAFGADAPVAVRSSATAEDLPDLSFAGQQDTYLNMIGAEAVLQAVIRCWSSLWTARAIEYRRRNQIDHMDVALAVVVQKMVLSEVSGVLFTANPLTGQRDETVIDATLGLGEALVSGQVEPDHYVVAAAGKIVSKTFGAKALVIVPQAGGGTRTVTGEARPTQALPDEVIVELAALGRQVQAHYGAPQDIEWGWAEGKLHLLQARPITSLYPLLQTSKDALLPVEPFRVFLSLGAVQGLLDPFTPLGQDLLRLVVVKVARMLGYRTRLEEQRVLLQAGMRLFINLTEVYRNPIGRRVIKVASDFGEPGSAEAFAELLQDPRLAPGKRPLSPRTAAHLIRAFAPVFVRVVVTILRPERARRLALQASDQLLVQARQIYASARTLHDHLELMDRMVADIPPVMLWRMIPSFGPGMFMLNKLGELAEGVPEGEKLVMDITRGMPYNVTTEMDLVLWDAASVIKADPESAAFFLNASPQELAQVYQEGSLPAAAQTAVHQFLERYGMRGVAELDIGRRRWLEEPLFVIQALQSYLQIEDPRRAPDQVFERSRREAEQAIETLAQAVQNRPGGSIQAHQVRFLAGRVRALNGMRELPKFTIIRVLGVVRQGLLESGRRLAASGVLAQPEDIFFLPLPELQHLAALQRTDLRWQTGARLADGDVPAAKVATRRANYERELRRRQIPRLLLSDGRAYYGATGTASSDDPNVITGSPVSSGVTEGVVRVVFDPHGMTLQPGEILVCPGTDPGWTPLFLAAGALVMEVGGLMTHGSVVAREYGLPAVVGVHAATTRLKTGQRVRVDGNRGVVTILE